MSDHIQRSHSESISLYAQLKALKEKANLSVADVLKVGLQKGEPLVGEAFRNGFMSALAEVYEAVCDGCEDAVMAIAIAQGAEPDSPK